MARRRDLVGAKASELNVVRLPSWNEILAPQSPWGLILRAGGGGLWLLRGAAEDVPELDARVVAGGACSTAGELFDEWSAALGFPDHFGHNWDAFDECIADLEWIGERACAVLVADAERLLDAEPQRLTTFADTLRGAADELADRERTLRVVFQSRFETRPELPDVLLEFGAADVA